MLTTLTEQARRSAEMALSERRYCSQCGRDTAESCSHCHQHITDTAPAIDISLAPADDLESAVTNDFLRALERRGVARMIPLGCSPDYAVVVDVTDAAETLPDMAPNPWFSIIYKHLGYRDVYMRRTAVEVIAGRTIWTFEACFCAGLPVRKGNWK